MVPDDDLERDLDAEAKNQLKKLSKTIQQNRKQIANLKRTQQLEIEEFKKAAEREYLQFSAAQVEERERIVAKQKKKDKKGKSSIRGSLRKLMDKTRKSIADDSFWQSQSGSCTLFKSFLCPVILLVKQNFFFPLLKIHSESAVSRQGRGRSRSSAATGGGHRGNFKEDDWLYVSYRV